MKIYSKLKISLVIVSQLFFVTDVYATKISVALEPMVMRAEVIVVAKALVSCLYCKTENPAQFEVLERLKGNYDVDQHSIKVISRSMGFNAGESYILFLRRIGNEYHWITGQSSRPKASVEEIDRTKLIIQKNQSGE